MDFIEFFKNLNVCFMCDKLLKRSENYIECDSCINNNCYKSLLVLRSEYWLGVKINDKIYCVNSNRFTHTILEVVSNNQKVIYREFKPITFFPNKENIEKYIKRIVKLKSFL